MSASCSACPFLQRDCRFSRSLLASPPPMPSALSTGLAVDLRWPNDLLIGARKTGGILVEANSESKGPPHARVAGIGINVHQREFPPDLATPATSLDLEAGRRISRQSLLVALLKSLEREASALLDPAAADALLQRWSRLPPGCAAGVWLCTDRRPVRALRPALMRMDSFASQLRMGLLPCRPAVFAPQRRTSC